MSKTVRFFVSDAETDEQWESRWERLCAELQLEGLQPAAFPIKEERTSTNDGWINTHEVVPWSPEGAEVTLANIPALPGLELRGLV